ncbi:MAG: dTDP-4-dehydrorhamnose reductase [Bdellovibrionota bacterium]
MRVKKVVVFGAYGQLGTDLVNGLRALKNVEVLSFDREHVDFGSEKDLRSFLEQTVGIVDTIINCVAMTNTTFCEEHCEQAYKVNAIPQAILGQHCTKVKGGLIYFSTDYVFSGESRKPYSESDTPRPINIYGASKLAGEDLVRATCDRHFIFRVSSLFGIAGALGKGGNFVETMIAKAQKGEELKVIDDQIMSPTSTGEVARVVCHFIENNLASYGTYHFAGKGRCSWYDFTKTILKECKLSGSVLRVSWREYPSVLRRPEYSVLDTTKISNLVTVPTWEEHLKNYLIAKGYIK